MKYLVMVMRTPNFQLEVIEPHREFLAELKSQGMLEQAGPFTDQSGGAYIITADNFDAAIKIAHSDPVHAQVPLLSLCMSGWPASEARYQ